MYWMFPASLQCLLRIQGQKTDQDQSLPNINRLIVGGQWYKVFPFFVCSLVIVAKCSLLELVIAVMFSHFNDDFCQHVHRE